MPNPFQDAGMIPGPGPALSTQNEVKDSVIHHGTFGGHAAQQKSWKTKAGETATTVKTFGLDFVKKAAMLALAKFFLEFCAMVIDAIMKALTKSGSSKMDITSPNVAYSATGQPAAPASTIGQPTSGWLGAAGRPTQSRDFTSSPGYGW